MFGGIGFMLDGHVAVGVSGQGGLMLRVCRVATGEHRGGAALHQCLRGQRPGVAGRTEEHNAFHPAAVVAWEACPNPKQ